MKISTSWTEVDQRLDFLGLLHMEHPSCRNFPFTQTADPSSLHTNLHPLMSICTAAPPPSPPSLNPPSFLLRFPTFSSHLPRLSQNSSSAPPVGVCRLRRTHLTGSGRMGHGCGSCGWLGQPSPATGESVPEREPPDGLCLNHFTAGLAR